MKTYGLIGKKLGHSFSKKYFTEKFEHEQIRDAQYQLFELNIITEFPALLTQYPDLKGLNVTIPYKQEVIPYLDRLAPSAKKTGAVNVIKIEKDGSLTGHNSDYYGFKISLEAFITSTSKTLRALVLGTGGAAKAVIAALNDLAIPFQQISRKTGNRISTYDELLKNPKKTQQYHLWINTTPLGMHPHTEECPALPYEILSSSHYLYDLVYNPEVTLFMKKGQEQGCHIKNGLEMLHLQAEKSWEIWNSEC